MEDSSETDISASSLDSFHSCLDYLDRQPSPSTSPSPPTDGHPVASSLKTDRPPVSSSSRTEGYLAAFSPQMKEDVVFPSSQREGHSASSSLQTERHPIFPSSFQAEGPAPAPMQSETASMESSDDSIHDASHYSCSSTLSSKSCLCEALKQVLHNGCWAKSEMGTSGMNQFQTLFDHLDFVRVSLDNLQQDYNTANVYECPQHGVLPEQVVQSKCDYCMDSKTVSLSDLLDGEASTPKAGTKEALRSAAVDVNGASEDVRPQDDEVGWVTTHFGADDRENVGDVEESYFDDKTPLQGDTTCIGEGLAQGNPGTLDRLTQDGQGDTGEPAHGTFGGLSPEEKEKRKILNKASKKLLKVNQKVKVILEEMATEDKAVQGKLEEVETNRLEVEKALTDHVKYLHSLLDYYHSQQQELLKRRHKDFLQELMVHKTEGLNFEAKLTDVQKKVEDTLRRIIKDHDITAANSVDVTALCDVFHRCVSSRPPKKGMNLTYMVEIPQVTADETQALLGQYVFTDNPENTRTSRSYPAPHWPGYEDAPAGNPASSKDPSSASSSQCAAPSQKTGGSDSAKPPPPKTAAGGSTKDSGAAEKPPPSSQQSAKGQKVKAAAKPAKPAAQKPQTVSAPASAQPTQSSASLGSKQKLSDMMASCSSIASTASSTKAKKRVRCRKRQKEKKAEAKKATEALMQPVMVTLRHEKAQPQKIEGRLKEAKGFAARPNGELWVVYGARDPHLDRINEQGKMLESFRVGGNAMHAASFSDENVLLSLHSPCCQLKLLDAKKETRETIKLPLIPTGLGVGSTGITVAGYKAVYWIPLDGGKNEWIVKQKESTLINACSCDVIILHGREIVCVADSEGHKVWFFEKLDNGEFAPLPLFTYASHNQQEKTIPFSPICVSALVGTSFIAVLDAASQSVLVVDVEKNEAVSVISGKHLCDGVPSLIAFALTDPGEDPKLWVASNSEYVYLVSLAFLY